ncbi:peptidylprolyl isomerase [Deinococcus murrayi]|uniref:peptidylprolyl isomerase n=1 Tax=Deinococcus murrayi TaxID=68910 RepID=UPI000489AFF4|nr:peptidylprolyl isomerase [Deinococcus murrayi]
MKRALLILTALLTLTACQDREADTTDTAANQTEEAQTDTPATDAEKEAADTAQVTEPGPVPAGYTLVPALSEKPVREYKSEPEFALEDGKDYYALIDTTKGQILADLYEQETPVTVNNFVTLARNHYYDGIKFHRVIDGFMAQTGDPTGTGSGGPGYQFADEFRTDLTFDAAGILAMANSGPATNGSQFFITFAPTDFLNGRHTIFGKVVQGEDVLKKLTRTADTTSGQEQPIEGATPDEMLTVRILTKG